MADDLNKNITITVSAETDKLEQSISNLNKIIDNLLTQQKQLVDSGNAASAVFQNNADKLDIFQKSLQAATAQLNSYIAAVNTSISTVQKDQALITALTVTRDKYAKALGDNSKKVTDLNNALKILTTATQQQNAQSAQNQASLDAQGKSIQATTQQATGLQGSLGAVSGALKQQKQDVDDNKKSFDLHGQVMDHLKTSFDEIKDVSGKFGPSLQDAAKGFDMMKSGLSVVKDGLNGIGGALKADGFDFLLQILQQLFDAFVHSSEGTKILQGVISAIGVVVNEVQTFFNNFKDGIIDAVTHPVDSLKALGNMIEENIINRFKAFSVILDGIIHLDFKKVADGAIQAVTGVTHATDKLAKAGKAIVGAVKETGKEIVTSYTAGYDQVNTKADESNKKLTKHFKTQKKHLKEIKTDLENTQNAIKSQSSSTDKFSAPKQDATDQTIGTDDQANLNALIITDAQKTSDALKQIESQRIHDLTVQEDAKLKARADKEKKAAQELKDFEIQTAQQVSTAAFGILQNSIKQEANAKVASLESQKTAELSNTSLTSAQKLIINAKYKKQEDQVKAKAFKQEQEASVAQALINGALAVTKVASQAGTLSALLIPGMIAETAIQVATIVAQKPPAYATGGLHYTSDGKGGMLPGYSRTDNTNAYLRSGEGIVVSEAMRDPWARNLVSAINVGFGGRDFSTTSTGKGFAVGGIFTDGGDANRYYNAPVNDQKNLANSIAYQMVNNFPPVYVDVKDINNQQNILAQTINRVNL
jgi:hypothetical protein